MFRLSPAIATALVTFVAACSPITETSPESSSPALASNQPPTLVSGSYAAMDEVPAQGGELRLETPIEIEVEVELEVEVDGEVVDDVSADRPRKLEKVTAIGFPLKHTDVKADVSGMISLYTVTQRFENPYNDPLEAVYVFPLGDKAAVVDYEIVIGDRTVRGIVKTRDAARAEYATAKASGHTAALLEEDKPNVFTQRIANIAPGEEILVRFKYIEMLKYRDNTYELVYPMVVGPRYLPADRPGRSPVAAHRAGAAPTPNAVSIPYVPSERVGNTVSFQASIDAGVPIVSTMSPSHDVAISRLSETSHQVALREHDSIPNRDLVLRYSAASRQTMVGAMTHRGAGEDGFFTLVIQPKAEYRTGDIRPRELIVLIDTSGSMSGQPLSQAKALAKTVVKTLGDRDVFNVITFASGTDAISTNPIRGDAAGRARGLAWIDGLSSGGGTQMEGGVLASLASKPGNDRLRMIYVLSDGYVGNDDVILGAAQKYLGHNRIYPVGVGSSPNRHLFERLADVGRGFSSYLLPADDPSEVATELVRRSSHPYLTNIEIDWGGLKVKDVTPKRLPDVHAGIPLVVSGRYTKPGQATVKLKAIGADRRIEIPLAVGFPHAQSRPPVRYLWARNRVDELMSRDHARVSAEDERAVTEIGIAFQMVTAYTSFIAVDRERIIEGGVARVVTQPVAIPAGVNIDTAVGPAPEPQPSYSSSSSRGGGGGGGWGGGGGGGGWGGGDTDPFTLLYLLLFLPVIISLRKLRTQ